MPAVEHSDDDFLADVAPFGRGDCPIFDSGRALEALAQTRLDDAVRDKLRFGNAARMMAAW